MEKVAVFAGSFCPFTKGHEDIVRRALPLFDKIVIAVGHNAKKQDLFPVEDRIRWIEDIYAGQPSIEVVAYQGLTVDLCREKRARHLLRGVRTVSDFVMEKEMHEINLDLDPTIETVFLPCSPELTVVSSSLVRELWSLGKDYSKYLSYKLPPIA